MPEADLEKIFEKFYRRARGDGRPAGTGLGLSIARGLVTAMGGTIRATSPAARKRGTRLTIPTSTYRAVLEVFVSPHSNDEFWYSNPPDLYIRENNLTTGRATRNTVRSS